MPNAQCPIPNAQCPMPNAQCPMPHAPCPMPMKNSRKRMIICSFCAVSCGLFSSFLGWQIASSLPAQRCQNQTWEFGKMICNVQTSPESMYKGWQGSTSGVWTGTILGAFFAGLGTRQLRR